MQGLIPQGSNRFDIKETHMHTMGHTGNIVLDWFNLSHTSCLIEFECYREILLAELNFVSQLLKDLEIR
jgi:hypothetical protein